MEIGRRSGGEVVSGEEELSLDLVFRRLIGECGGGWLVKMMEGFVELRSVRGGVVRVIEGDERVRLIFLRWLR